MMQISCVRSGVEGESEVEYEELNYQSDHIPNIGDRITHMGLGMRVTERTWCISDYREIQYVQLWVEAE